VVSVQEKQPLVITHTPRLIKRTKVRWLMEFITFYGGNKVWESSVDFMFLAWLYLA